MTNYARAALGEINEIREEFGLPTLVDMPRSRWKNRNNSIQSIRASCPLAVALEGVTKRGQIIHAEVGHFRITIFDGQYARERNIPKAMERFMRSFDQGHQKKYAAL